MNLPSKYILIGTNPLYDSFLLELKIVPITSELNLIINIHKLKTKLTPALVNSFISNDENEDYFNKVPKQMVYTVSLSHQQSQSIMFILHQNVNNPQNANKQLININFNIQPPLQLNMTFKDIFTMYTFVSQFVMNYLYFKTEFFKNNQVVNPSNVITTQMQTTTAAVNRPILTLATRTSQEHTVKNVEIEENITQDINFESALNQALSLCPNNIFI